MKKAIKAEVGKTTATNEPYVRYIFADGTDNYKVGGKRAWRNNNPGNIQWSKDVEKFLNPIGRDHDGFTIFPDYRTGDWAMRRLLRRWAKYRDKTIEDAIATYAHPEDNPTEAYIEYVTKTSGLARTKVIMEMTDDEFDRFQRAMREFENSRPGFSLIQDGAGEYYQIDYLLNHPDASPDDFSNYGPDVPRKYEGYIEFTPKGFKTKSMIPVDSSNVDSVGYNESNHTLTVAFDSGGLYSYSNVPVSTFERFLTAPSKGKFHHRSVKDRFGYRRIG